MFYCWGMYYQNATYIDNKTGNNVFAYEQRVASFGGAKIAIPALIDWTIDDVQLGDDIVFAEMDGEDIKLCKWLRSIVRLSYSNRPIYVMDNHNHALYCWYREYLAGTIEKWIVCVHIDQHSDMKDPVWWIDEKKEHDLSYIAQYMNEVCTIADFIQPVLRSGLLSDCIQVRTEYGLLHFDRIEKPYVLDIDIDFWAPEMSIEEFDRTIEKTRQLIAGSSLVTIATSPYFIDQERAVEIVKLLLS